MSRRVLEIARSHVWSMGAVLVLLAVTTVPVVAQSQLWVDQLGTSEYDAARAAAPDGAGGLYVVGDTLADLGGPNAGGSDVWLGRHDGTGNQLWIRQFGTSSQDLPFAAAPDGSGGAYVAGRTLGSLGGTNAGSWDAWVARFDNAGNLTWARQLGTSLRDEAFAVAMDGTGGAYLAGWTDGDLGGPSVGVYDAWLARYDGAGNRLWVLQIGTNGIDQARATTPDGSGGVYVTGGTGGDLGGSNAGGPDAWLARYDSTGTQLWLRQLGTSGNENTLAAAPDGSGGTYVAGLTGGGLGGPFAGAWDAWLARYDSTGNQLWIRQLGTSDNETATAAATDGSGGVYVTGWTLGGLGGPNVGGPDSWLTRFDSSGSQLWIQQLGTSEDEGANAAAPDGSGGVYLGGSTEGDLGGPNAGGEDAWLARYDSTCPTPVSYCVASSTSIAGCQAAIAGSGAPSLAAPTGFTITSGSVPGGNVGMCFFGNRGEAAIPFGTLGGRICAQPPLFRCSPKTSGGSPGACDGKFVYTLQDLIDASSAVFPGAILNAQIWSRDPANPDGYLLSDGLEFTACP